MSQLVRLRVKVPEGELRHVAEAGRLILLARYEGRLFALDDWCNHAGCLLSQGRIEADAAGRPLVLCPCHEIGFDLESGKNATSPGICGDQEPFSVREEPDGVVVELPDARGVDGGSRGA